MKKALILSAYDAKSHQYWRSGLVDHLPDIDWTVLTLPARYFSWRIRGNSLSWVYSQRELLTQPYDVIIATSIVDLATLKGMVPQLALIPSIVYFHENQFAYPVSQQQHRSLEPQMVNLYSALVATHVVFNSDYNRRTFLSGVSALIKRLPEKLPNSIVAQLSERSSVLPVPMTPVKPSGEKGVAAREFTLLWNHRWEYDKGPERLLLLLRRLRADGVAFRLHLLGESFRQKPKEFSIIAQEFQQELLTLGYVESHDAYRQCLAQSDVVLSTSLHDFQGLSILEAVAAGCVPVLPRRLAYPDFFDEEYLYASHLNEAEKEAESAANAVKALFERWQRLEALSVPNIDDLYWSACQAPYRELIATVMASKVL